LLVAGCAGAGGASSSSTGSAGGASFSGSGGANGSAASAPEARSAKGAAAGGAGQPAAAQATGLVAPDQSIIYTASLTVRVHDAARAAAAAAGDVSTAGGYTAAEQARTSHAGQRPRVTLTVKVPVAGYPAALRQLAGLGKQTALSQKSTDVTQEVADVSSRVTSQQDAIAQLRTLLKRAGSVSGLLQVQDQISADESSLEALLAQQRSLAHETTYATVSVLLLGPLPRTAAVHRHRSQRGFAAGLAAGWHGLGHATAWVLTALGVLLPFGAVLAVLGGIGWLARRRLARHRTGPAQPTEGPAS
jgi:Domain of unknown function (DUF4349)